jgi:hypothetical protein
MKILTHIVYREGDIWPCQSKILESANNASIFSGIIGELSASPLAPIAFQWKREVSRQACK